MHSDEVYMRRAIQLSLLGKGDVAPNPMVGAVIVHNGCIIGEGYHQHFGEAHAEVNAINSVEDESLLPDSTIYVTLEPCAHYGKTPPCANLLAEKRFKRVVIGAVDPHAAVDGKGIEIMKSAGIEIVKGVLSDEVKAVNKHFFTYHSEKRPYVLLKWAQTKNGFMDDQGEQAWISSSEVKPIVHRMRDEYQAILVGKNTVFTDDPELTVRAVKGSNPVRIVVDPNLELPHTKRVFNNEAPTFVFNKTREDSDGHLHYIKLGELAPKNILNKLYELNIISVLIEGGAFTISKFIEANSWDEAFVIVGEAEFKDGTNAPRLDRQPESVERFFGNQILQYRNL